MKVLLKNSLHRDKLGSSLWEPPLLRLSPAVIWAGVPGRALVGVCALAGS